MLVYPGDLPGRVQRPMAAWSRTAPCISALARTWRTVTGTPYQGKAHRLAYPGLPVLFAGTFKATSAFSHGRSLVPELVIMLLIGLATLGLTYRLFCFPRAAPPAVIITAGVAMSRVFYRYKLRAAFRPAVPAGDHVVSRRLRGVCSIAGPSKPQPRVTARSADARWFDWLLLVAGLMVASRHAARPCGRWFLRSSPRRSGRFFPHRQSIAAVGAALDLAWRFIAAVTVFYIRDPRHAETSPGAACRAGYAEEDEMFNFRGDKLVAMARSASGHISPLVDAVTKATFGMQLPWGSKVGARHHDDPSSGMGLLFYRPLWACWWLDDRADGPAGQAAGPLFPAGGAAAGIRQGGVSACGSSRSLPRAPVGNKVFAAPCSSWALATNGAKVFGFIS